MIEKIQPSLVRHTTFSQCRRYRYTLWREWDDDLLAPHADFLLRKDQFAMFIGLNPSTADENKDDPTIRRCIAFAKRWGYGSLVMTNLFAWRDTQPKKMMLAHDPVSEDGGGANDRFLDLAAKNAGIVICAWGKHGSFLSRARIVADRLGHIRNLHCLGVNKDGSPQHPLYVPAATEPRFWRAS